VETNLALTLPDDPAAAEHTVPIIKNACLTGRDAGLSFRQQNLRACAFCRQ
jgi:hypothetical protein